MNHDWNWGPFAKTGKPASTPDSQVRKTHIKLIGATGSMKSVLVQNLISQLAKNKDAVFIVFDCGASNPVYAAFKEATKDRETMEFSTDQGIEGANFDPLHLPEEKKDPLVLVSHLADALSIAHGLDYGKFYFLMSCINAGLTVSETLSKRGITLTLHTLFDALDRLGYEYRDGQLLKHCIQVLKLYPQLNTIGVPEANVLNFGRVLKRRQCVYVHAPCMGGNTTARQIVTLMMGCLLMEMMLRKQKGDPLVPVTVITEEGHCIVGSFTDTWMNTVRKFGGTSVLTAQHSGQFASGDRDILTTMRSCCGIKLFFSASPEEREFIMGESLDRLKRYRSGQDDSQSVFIKQSWKETLEPSRSANWVRRISATPQHAIFMHHSDGKFCNPREIIVPYYSKTLAEHERLEAFPFPRRPTPTPAPVPAPSGARHLAQLTDPPALARQKDLEELQAALLARMLG